MRARATILLPALLLLLAAPATADEPQVIVSPSVRVYTNADLERLGTLPTQEAPIVDDSALLGWDYVQTFIDRQHARLDVRHEQELERRRLDLEEAELEVRVDDSYLPYNYLLYGRRHVGSPGHRSHPVRDRPHGALNQRQWVARQHALAQGARPIVPIHARSTFPRAKVHPF